MAGKVPRLIGYARVSTDDQNTDSQVSELRSAGCSTVVEEIGSGASRRRPALLRILNELQTNDILIVVRIDRLARSVQHLLAVIDEIEKRGAHIRSLRDPIDTSTPQGLFALQVLGAVAQLERSLISERTKAGMKAARMRGRLPGNPGVRERHPEALQAISLGLRNRHLRRLIETAPDWLPTVKRLRPEHRWEDVARIINRRGDTWTAQSLRRAAQRLADVGLVEKSVLDRSPKRSATNHLPALVAGIATAEPDLTLRDIGARLEDMQERTPRGERRWSPATVKMLLERAKPIKLRMAWSDSSNSPGDNATD